MALPKILEESRGNTTAPTDEAAFPAAERCTASVAYAAPGEVRCPVCAHIVPPEHIGYKLHCRRCGYLESCCNPV